MSELLDHSSAIVDAWSVPGGPAPGAPDGPTNRITNELSRGGRRDRRGRVVLPRRRVPHRRRVSCSSTRAAEFTGGGRRAVAAGVGRRSRPTPSSTRTATSTTSAAAATFVADAAGPGRTADPRVVGHENVPARFDRYRAHRTAGTWPSTPASSARLSRRWARHRRRPPVPPRRRRPVHRHVRRPLDLHVGDLEVRAAPRPGRDRRPHLGVDPPAPGRLRRRLPDLGLPQRRQPPEGAALPGRVGAALRQMAALEPELLLPPTACRSSAPSGSRPCSTTSPRRSSAWSPTS